MQKKATTFIQSGSSMLTMFSTATPGRPLENGYMVKARTMARASPRCSRDSECSHSAAIFALRGRSRFFNAKVDHFAAADWVADIEFTMKLRGGSCKRQPLLPRACALVFQKRRGVRVVAEWEAGRQGEGRQRVMRAR